MYRYAEGAKAQPDRLHIDPDAIENSRRCIRALLRFMDEGRRENLAALKETAGAVKRQTRRDKESDYKRMIKGIEDGAISTDRWAEMTAVICRTRRQI